MSYCRLSRVSSKFNLFTPVRTLKHSFKQILSETYTKKKIQIKKLKQLKHRNAEQQA